MINEGIRDGDQPGAAGTEGGRRPTEVPAAPEPRISPDGVPIGTVLNGQLIHSDPQVLERPAHRRFSKPYKRDILRQIAACTKDGEIGALLRREGLYSSLVCNWRQQEERGRLNDSAADRRAAKPEVPEQRLAQLQRENDRLKARLKQAELILEI